MNHEKILNYLYKHREIKPNEIKNINEEINAI